MLENQFDFVLLAEFFDESLVILAKRLCWDLDQVTRSDWQKTWNFTGEIFEAEFKKEGCCERNNPGNYGGSGGRRQFCHTFLPRNGYLMTTNSTTTFFESLSAKS